jgi:hypothetical protein
MAMYASAECASLLSRSARSHDTPAASPGDDGRNLFNVAVDGAVAPPYPRPRMPEFLTLAPTSTPRVFRAADGKLLSPPDGWDCLPPGDAGLTRRVKAAGPSWVVVERRGRKVFSQGLWAPASHIEAARAALDAERATDGYAKKRASELRRRQAQQTAYVQQFEAEVLAFLDFSPPWTDLGRQLAAQVTALATPVGSGTVARTERIPVERRAEAAVVAWMRHQTTVYDRMAIPRIKGMRRQVRRELAEMSRVVLDRHRAQDRHDPAPTCPLCAALK